MKKLWFAFVAVLVVSFSILGWIGSRIYQDAPPIPERVVTTEGQVIIDSGEILKGQQVWQALGGMQVGSIWGHGSYVAPDWTADWLHRECVFLLDEWSTKEFQSRHEELSGGQKCERQAQLQGRLRQLLRTNRYDPASGTLIIEPERGRAFEANRKHYAAIFTDGQVGYAIPKGAVTDPERLRHLAAFFFWTSWAAAANRPGDEVSYTLNWPHEPLVGNVPTGEAVVWTGVSIIML